ncbi:anti-sigma factor [Demequina sp.]|uniref:anti-sigma factor domain-containing protein n=1 Tax=Demequina sp. TaxID=2050685 RepID=UPI0025CFF144|nr:anti-sigma factor [Demequina sp.]
MTTSGVEEAYREAGPLVHTLALRALGSVDEAEDVVRRVFAAAAAGGSLDARDLLHDAAERITGDLERRVRAKLEALDDPDIPVDGVTDQKAVVAEADRILLRTSMDRLPTASREALEQALVHGSPRYELAMTLGISEPELEERLRDALLDLWSGARLSEPHAPPEALASRAIGIRAADGHRAHISDCPECRDAWRSLNDLVGQVTRLPAAGPVLPPRATLWDELVKVIEAGEGTEPEADWREEARASAERAHRKRTLIMTAAVVMASLFVGLTVVLAQILVEPDRPVIASGVLTDPREGGGDAGSAAVEGRGDQGEVVVVNGPYAEYPDSFLELWLIPVGGDRVSLGQLTSSRYEVAVPPGIGTAAGGLIEITREPWDGIAGPSTVVVARGSLG